MGILSSTKSGKSIVPLTINYLTEKHWRFKAPSRVAQIDYDVIWKNKCNYLKIKRDGFRMVQYIYLEFDAQKYTYKFTVKTLGDLELVEKFWQKSKNAVTKEAIDVLKQNEQNLKIEDNNLWDYSDYSVTYDKISKYSYKEYYESNDKSQPWKNKNKYFASYFN